MMISILVPTRKRPENVVRLINSAMSTASNPVDLEFLFYVDHDDSSFPMELASDNVRVFRGPRIWLSLMQNFLYVQARGDILMYGGDDIVFRTKNWDNKVREAFSSSQDNLILVYPNDLATHGVKMAIHGFLHRDWIDTLGYWVAPGRGSLYDLWHTDVARNLGRLVYLNDIEIEHVHFRQGAAKATFDSTYSDVSQATRSWVPMKTYKKLKRERRIDFLLVSSRIEGFQDTDLSYFLGNTLARYKDKIGLGSLDRDRLRTVRNHEFFFLFFANLVKIFLGKRKLKKTEVK